MLGSDFTGANTKDALGFPGAKLGNIKW